MIDVWMLPLFVALACCVVLLVWMYKLYEKLDEYKDEIDFLAQQNKALRQGTERRPLV